MFKTIPILVAIAFVVTGCPKIEMPDLLPNHGTEWRLVDKGKIIERLNCTHTKCDYKVKTSASTWDFTNYDKKAMGYQYNRVCKFTKKGNEELRCEWVGNNELRKYIGN